MVKTLKRFIWAKRGCRRSTLIERQTSMTFISQSIFSSVGRSLNAKKTIVAYYISTRVMRIDLIPHVDA
jgi:hypothetical protein